MRETYIISFFFWILYIKFWPVIPNEHKQRTQFQTSYLAFCWAADTGVKEEDTRKYTVILP